MEKSEFALQQFLTLREEIKCCKARLFWTVSLGLMGVPVITFLAQMNLGDGEVARPDFVGPLIPYLILVLTVLFIAENNALMRAGRYIREHLEPTLAGKDGWESWLESRADLRQMDKYFFACFTIVFCVYYFFSIGFAIRTLWSLSTQTDNRVFVVGGTVTYGVGAIWLLVTLLQHWKSATATSNS